MPRDLPAGISLARPLKQKATGNRYRCFCHLKGPGEHQVSSWTWDRHFERCRKERIPFNDEEVEIYETAEQLNPTDNITGALDDDDDDDPPPVLTDSREYHEEERRDEDNISPGFRLTYGNYFLQDGYEPC